MQFARDNPNITIVGVGAGSAANGDSLDGAFQFVERHGATLANMTMLYDVSFRSWRTFGVSTQPWSVGFDADGNQLFSQPGRIDLSTVKAALSA